MMVAEANISEMHLGIVMGAESQGERMAIETDVADTFRHVPIPCRTCDMESGRERLGILGKADLNRFGAASIPIQIPDLPRSNSDAIQPAE